jgi:predicted MPP superfamily phosphohydrolase
MASKPDLIAVTGDIYHGQGLTPNDAPSLKGVFNGLAAEYGVFGVLGNHDHKLGASFVRKQVETHTTIRLIDNIGLAISKGSDQILLGGVGDLWEDKIDLKAALGKGDPKIPRILLSHNPDIAEHIDDDDATRVDLQLSGHSHGGQMVLPGIYNPYSRFSQYGSKFNRGLVQGKRHPVFVSKGIARLNHMRLFALPDVACIELTRAA